MCEGFGHIKGECPTYLKTQKEDTESDHVKEFAKAMKALAGR